jgi:DNA-binding transcriptional ArsR family regulator
MSLSSNRIFKGHDPEVSKETAFAILGNERRRLVLHALLQKTPGTDVSLGDLAEQVTAWENSVSVTEVRSDERKSVYTSLQQLHLPKMDETGIVEFDEREGTVTVTPTTQEFTIYLEIVNEGEIPWHGYYLGFGVIGASLLVALATDTAPFAGLPELAWMAFLVVALLVSAIAHTYVARQRRVGKGETPPEVDR